MRIQTNLSALNTHNRVQANKTSLTKTLEKLSSGYKINRAGDNAASLSISEGMKAQIRGLNRATLNAQDGLSLINTSDGILQESIDVVHRIRELTIQSLNDTVPDDERKLIQNEINSLKAGIDNMSEDSSFNGSLKAVDPHFGTYNSMEGIRKFDGPVVIASGINDSLILEADGQHTDIKIPAGVYDPFEKLLHELDKITEQKNPNVIFSLTEDRRLAVQVENSKDLIKMKGNGTALFFDYEVGNKPGMIIGTTDFSTAQGLLHIRANENDHLSFFVGPTNKVDIKFQPGNYSRQQVIDKLNQELQRYGAVAEAYGNKNISVHSDIHSITGLSGNMFKIDQFTSIFYDNVNYGNVSKQKSYMYGANDLSDGIQITSLPANISINGYTSSLTNKSITIDLNDGTGILPRKVSGQELVDLVNRELQANDMQVSAKLFSNRFYIESELYGREFPVSFSINEPDQNNQLKNQIVNQVYETFHSPTAIKGVDTAATIYGYYANRDQITVKAAPDNVFAFNIYKPDNSTETISISVDEGDYDAQTLQQHIQQKIDAITTPLNIQLNVRESNNSHAFSLYSETSKISLANNYLTNSLFTGARINNPTISNGYDGPIIYPQEGTVGLPRVEKYSARVMGTVDLTSGFEVKNTDNTLSFKLNGTSHSIQLSPKVYSKDELIEAINVKLVNVNATAKVVSNKLVLESTDKGSGVTFSDVTGFAMQSTTFLTAPTDSSSPTKTTSYIVSNRTFADNEKIIVEAPNNELNIKYDDLGTSKEVSIVIPDGEFTPSQLVLALQSSLPTDLPFSFAKENNKILLKADGPGSEYKLPTLSGAVFEHVFKKQSYTLSSNQYGGVSNTVEAYTVGRQDLVNQIEIFPTTNDLLTFDLNYKGNKHTIDVSISGGTYSSAQLVSVFNDQLSKQLEKAGIPKDAIEAQIGIRNNNQNVTNDRKFVLVEKTKNDGRDDSGRTIIDGVRGTAASTLFYPASDTPKPSHLTGIVNLAKGLTIKEDENDELSIDINDQAYHLKFPAGEYTQDELLTVVNEQLVANNTGLIASYHYDQLRFSYKENGIVTLDGLAGNARDSLFYKTNRREEDDTLDLQIGANANQSIAVNKTVMSTKLLKLQALYIGERDYAEIAVNKLDNALKMLSEKQGYLGAMQNRLDHIVNGNKNTEEQLQKALSTIRDTDMAKEMMNYTKQNILNEAAQALLAQAYKVPENVLQLLK